MNRLITKASLFACLSTALASHAAFDAYLKIEGVDGEAADAKHARWIEVGSFANGGTGPAAATGRAGFSDLCFTKFTDKASPVLDQSCAQGRRFPSATLELITSGANRVRFYQIILSNVVVSSVSASGSANGVSEKPVESVCLNYSKISWTYTEFDANGAPVGDIKAWWDIALNIGGGNVNPVLRVTGAQLDSGTLRLSWPATAGKTYNILNCPVVNGNYRSFQSVTAQSDGPMNLSLPIAGGAAFFLIQQSP